MYVTDDGTLNKVPVKQERPDEAEIRELAAKMVEANKAKMGTVAAQAAAAAAVMPPRPPGYNQQLSGLLGYFNKKPAVEPGSPKPLSEGKVAIDDESQRGRFGWTSFGDNHIPYIFRASEKYCAVRILESKLLNKYLSYLHSDIYSCTCIRSYYITEAESKLLNDINIKHCENQFGREQFTCKDLVVRLADAKEFYTFLDVCYTKLTSGSSQNVLVGHNKPDKCGFIRINEESVVPYTIKGGLKYVPLFYFEGETDNLKLKAEKLEGWDLSYLKFCCKVQGIRNELFASETCSVISLNDIKSYFPPGTGFEDYWPSKVMDSQLLVSNKGSGSGGGWTKQPPAPPVTKSVQNNVSKNSMNARGAALQNMLPQRNLPASTLQRVSQRPVVTTHPVHSSPSVASSIRNNQVSQPMMNVQTVNGWSGLVGGQPTFPNPLVSQANSIIRMTPSSLNMHNQLAVSNKNYNRPSSRSRTETPQQYPVYSNTTMQPAVPPPLIRATAHSSQPNLGYPTYGKDDWVSTTYTTPSLGVPNPATASTYPQMLGLSPEQVQALLPQPTSAASLMSHAQRHTPPVLGTSHPVAAHSNSHTKYPPPLIPVNGSSNNKRDTRGRKPLIPIADTHPSQLSVNCQVQPYQVQKALVEDKLVPCINFKPYIYSELLMTLPDFVAQFFPSCDIESCRQVLSDVLMVELYQGNRLQMEMLMKNGKCSSLNEELPLIQVRQIMQYMPQLKYMLKNRNMGIPAQPQPAHSNEEHSAKKRQRTS